MGRYTTRARWVARPKSLDVETSRCGKPDHERRPACSTFRETSVRSNEGGQARRAWARGAASSQSRGTAFRIARPSLMTTLNSIVFALYLLMSSGTCFATVFASTSYDTRETSSLQRFFASTYAA